MILGLLLPRSPKKFLQTCMLADLTIQCPNGGFMNKFSLVVKVRLIKGKIDHPPIFKKIRYFSDPDCVLGSQKHYNTRGFLCQKNGRKMLGNNFKTILKEERWSKLPTFMVLVRLTIKFALFQLRIKFIKYVKWLCWQKNLICIVTV